MSRKYRQRIRALALVCLFSIVPTLVESNSCWAQEASLPRPVLGDFEQRARALFDAIVRDQPTLAEPAFFPRDAFVRVKAMQNPGRYYDKLHARFIQDIHTLHRALGQDASHATYERFELVKRGGYVKPGEEGNHLPYWAARHNWLHYRVGKQLKKLEVRVVITWEDRWYVIHLSEFH